MEAGSANIYVLHDVNALDLDPKAAGFKSSSAVIRTNPHGESTWGSLHQSGSAGPRRFHFADHESRGWI